MSLKFYTDTHIAKQVAVQLRQRGVDIVRCEEVGLAEADDETHLEYATQNSRMVVSMDDDFASLHSQWQKRQQSHSGIVLVSSRLQGERNIGKIVTALYEYFQLIEAGAGTLEADIHNQLYFI